ncbi:MAG: RagB/SusD family nutrient uptake outer membrane protein [Flavobacteriaceae bacterium]|nr:MAG: RagB/SusD family nutrient uptake outer membrane protein [Flavobacteriaceae bacterium]
MKTIKLLIMSLLVLAFTGCDDDEFLTQKSPDALDSASFWRDATDANAGLTAAYGELESRSEFWDGWQEGRPIVEWYRSDYVVPGVDGSNYAHWMSIFNFTYTNGHTFVNLLWRTNYKGLNYANQVIAKVGAMTEEQISPAQRKQIIGEATFLRAYYHFKLLTIYKQIILRTDLISEETLELPLASRSEAYAQIIEDFKAAASMLPVNNTVGNIGRANKGTAMAYLGKVYLYKAGDASATASDDFKNAADAMAVVVNSGAYSLEVDFESSFNGENENNQESIFELQFKTADGDIFNATMLHAFIADPSFGGWGGIEGSPALLTEMKSEGEISSEGMYDARLYGSLYFKDPYYNAGNNMQGSNWDALMLDTYKESAASKDNTVYFKKFLPLDVENAGYNGLNVVLMRYADVLLMYAEALNETGDTSKAIEIINKIRLIHGNMPAITATSTAGVKTQLIHERTMEFSLESSRFYDLRRWGMLDAAMQTAGRTGFSAEAHGYLPVPLSEINANSKVD